MSCVSYSRPATVRARLHAERVRPQRHRFSGSSAEIEPAGVSRRRPRQRQHIGISGAHEFLEGSIRDAVINEVDEAKSKLGADPSPDSRLPRAGRPDEEHHRSVAPLRHARSVLCTARGFDQLVCVWHGRHVFEERQEAIRRPRSSSGVNPSFAARMVSFRWPAAESFF